MIGLQCHSNQDGALEEGLSNSISQSVPRKLDHQSEGYQQESASYVQKCSWGRECLQRRAYR